MNLLVENRKRLLVAGFLTLIAAGIGFGVRGGLLAEWSKAYGFTMTELGTITGGGLLGFGLVILIAGFLIDTFGYKRLLLAAFAFHLISAVMLMFTSSVFQSVGKGATYELLWWSAILFAVGNGLCEAVINPLTAALYPKEKVHYLNILHAGWPGGLVLGGLIALGVGAVPWEFLLTTYLIPAFAYGAIAVRETFPKTEAQKGEISYAGMLVACCTPFFFLLLILHAMIGYVELGTDSWIAKLTGNILNSPQGGILLFIYTSILMFVLRFFAGPIAHKISSLGLLAASSCLGAVGLTLLAQAETLVWMLVAVTIYGFGKTFLWPTMLGIVGERFAQSATVGMALLGFIGMMSAGLLGGPGIGYKQDRFASEKLSDLSEESHARYRAGASNSFLFFRDVHGLDGRKVGVVLDDASQLDQERSLAQQHGSWESPELSSLRELDQWWQENQRYAEQDKPLVAKATLYGSRQAIRLTALVPATMAIGFLLLLVGSRAMKRPANAEA